jgi:alkylation response protein AidB-like acyl-CoA dehydrogenase
MTEWDIFHFVVLNDELCRAGVGALSAVAGASAIGVPPIVRFGTEEQKSRWLPSLFTGQNLFCLGATEPTGRGSSRKLHLLLEN